MVLTYALAARCRCGAKLAHTNGRNGCWDCSAVLLGTANPAVSPGAVDHFVRRRFVAGKAKRG